MDEDYPDTYTYPTCQNSNPESYPPHRQFKEQCSPNNYPCLSPVAFSTIQTATVRQRFRAIQFQLNCSNPPNDSKNQGPPNRRTLLETTASPIELQISKIPKVPAAGESFNHFQRFKNLLSSDIHPPLGTIAPLFKRAGRSEPSLAQNYRPKDKKIPQETINHLTLYNT